MPFPATSSHDIFLRALLRLQVEDVKARVSVEEVLRAIPSSEQDKHQSVPLPKSVLNDIRFLERHKLLNFFPSNPHVQLTPLGIYAALLFDPLS
jgi:hypothetical protein